MSYYPRVEIIPNLWVGSAGDAHDAMFLRNVHLIVNCTPNVPCTPGVRCIRVAVDDDPGENRRMYRAFKMVLPVIDDTIRAGKTVLLHCVAGIQRSATMAAAYLMYVNKMYGRRVSAVSAMQMVKRRKSEAFDPSPTFFSALLAYER